MPRYLQLLWYFYKPLWLWNAAFTIICLGFADVYGAKVAGFLLLFKLIGYASATFLQSYTAKEVHMYFRNAGYSIRRLHCYVYAFDLTVYLLLLTLLLLIKP